MIGYSAPIAPVTDRHAGIRVGWGGTSPIMIICTQSYLIQVKNVFHSQVIRKYFNHEIEKKTKNVRIGYF